MAPNDKKALGSPIKLVVLYDLANHHKIVTYPTLEIKDAGHKRRREKTPGKTPEIKDGRKKDAGNKRRREISPLASYNRNPVIAAHAIRHRK